MRLALLITVPLGVLAIALGGTHILLERLFILIAIVMLFGLLFAISGIWGLKGYLKTPGEHQQAGQPFRVEAVIENKNRLPKAFVRLRIKSKLKQATKAVINMPARRTFLWQNSLLFPQRGYYELGPLMAEVTDPFGMFRFQRRLDKEKEILIYPATVDLPLFWAESQGESRLTRNSLLTSEASGAIAGVREYVPGDGLNRIHWRSTAHRGKLTVKEFDIDFTEKVWVIPDLSKDFNFGSGIETTEEYIITIAASIVKKYADAGREVGLMAQSQQYHFYSAQAGYINLWRIMEALAAMKANGHVPLRRLLSRASEQLKGNAVAVIVTASAQDEMLDTILSIKKQGIRLVTVLINSASFGSGITAPNLADRLEALKIPVYSVSRGDNLAEALNAQGKNLAAKSGTEAQYLAR
jgi:uncharacterized protein (DUF58 family)